MVFYALQKKETANDFTFENIENNVINFRPQNGFSTYFGNNNPNSFLES